MLRLGCRARSKYTRFKKGDLADRSLLDNYDGAAAGVSSIKRARGNTLLSTLLKE